MSCFLVNTVKLMICNPSHSSAGSVLSGDESFPGSISLVQVGSSSVVFLEGSLVDGSTGGVVSVKSVSAGVGGGPPAVDALAVVSEPVVQGSHSGVVPGSGTEASSAPGVAGVALNLGELGGGVLINGGLNEVLGALHGVGGSDSDGTGEEKDGLEVHF